MKNIIFFIAGFLSLNLIFHFHLPRPSQEEVKSIVIARCQDAPILIDIARRESDTRQFNDDGSVYLSRVNTDGSYDKGIFQINSCHWKEARRLGYDLDSVEGNIGFAKLLYKKEGVKPWHSSSINWRKDIAKRFLARNR